MTDHFGTGADVDVTAHQRHTAVRHAQRHLLEDQAVRTNHHGRVDDDAVGVRQQQSTADARVDGDVGARHSLPKDVTQNGPAPSNH